jgi:hypothetical protein
VERGKGKDKGKDRKGRRKVKKGELEGRGK